MLKTNQAPSAVGAKFRARIEMRMRNGEVPGVTGMRDGMSSIFFITGEREDVTELAEYVARQGGYRLSGWTDLADECWHDLESDGGELEVGYHPDHGLYIMAASDNQEDQIALFAERLRVRVGEDKVD